MEAPAEPHISPGASREDQAEQLARHIGWQVPQTEGPTFGHSRMLYSFPVSAVCSATPSESTDCRVNATIYCASMVLPCLKPYVTVGDLAITFGKFVFVGWAHHRQAIEGRSLLHLLDEGPKSLLIVPESCGMIAWMPV